VGQQHQHQQHQHQESDPSAEGSDGTTE
jgi:hypothetical protein